MKATTVSSSYTTLASCWRAAMPQKMQLCAADVAFCVIPELSQFANAGGHGRCQWRVERLLSLHYTDEPDPRAPLRRGDR